MKRFCLKKKLRTDSKWENGPKMEEDSKWLARSSKNGKEKEVVFLHPCRTLDGAVRQR